MIKLSVGVLAYTIVLQFEKKKMIPQNNKCMEPRRNLEF